MDLLLALQVVVPHLAKMHKALYGPVMARRAVVRTERASAAIKRALAITGVVVQDAEDGDNELADGSARSKGRGPKEVPGEAPTIEQLLTWQQEQKQQAIQLSASERAAQPHALVLRQQSLMEGVSKPR